MTSCARNMAGFQVHNMDTEEMPYRIETIVDGLYVPWAIAISDYGRLYFTERSGTIRVIDNGRLIKDPLIIFGPPFVNRGEGGLMGIAIDPNFAQNHYIYVMQTYTEHNQLLNRIIRLKENNNTAQIDQIIIDKIPGGLLHNGGRIKIGPDQKLYVTTGDAGNTNLAQNINSLAGKILRLELDGSIPKNNPIPNSPIYSLGHRNPQGLAWNSEDILYASDHGATAHDEINIIYPGANYGWPYIEGEETSTEFLIQNPIIQSGNSTWSPSGMTFVTDGPWKGQLLVAALRGEQLLDFSIDENGIDVKKVDSWLQNGYGRLREAVEDKDGTIYITTSNRDGRGAPSSSDDKIIRLVPNDRVIL